MQKSNYPVKHNGKCISEYPEKTIMYFSVERKENVAR